MFFLLLFLWIKRYSTGYITLKVKCMNQGPICLAQFLDLGEFGGKNKHFNDILYNWIHIDILFKAQYQRCTPLGKRKNHCSFIFLSRLNWSNSALPRAETTPQCSSSTPTCFRYLKHSENPLGNILLLVVLQHFCWCDLDWAEVQVRNRLCGLRLQKNKLRLISEEEKNWRRRKKNCRNLFTRTALNGFTPKDEQILAEL